jgi:anti-sigma B factor antagonist
MAHAAMTRPDADGALAAANLDRGAAAPAGGSLAIELRREEGAVALLLSGELDGESGATLAPAVRRCCEDGAGPITIDLRGVTFIDSSGLWAITVALRWCERRGRSVRLLRGPDEVHWVFEVTGLSDVLPFAR